MLYVFIIISLSVSLDSLSYRLPTPFRHQYAINTLLHIHRREMQMRQTQKAYLHKTKKTCAVNAKRTIGVIPHGMKVYLKRNVFFFVLDTVKRE